MNNKIIIGIVFILCLVIIPNASAVLLLNYSGADPSSSNNYMFTSTINRYAGFPFNISSSVTLDNVSIRLAKTGTPEGLLYAKIYSVNITGISASSSYCNSSLSVNMSSLSTQPTYTWVSFNINTTPCNLNVATGLYYYVVIENDASYYNDGSYVYFSNFAYTGLNVSKSDSTGGGWNIYDDESAVNMYMYANSAATLDRISFISPTPSNNAFNFITNNTLSIRTNASVIPGNTTIRVYNSTGANVSSATNNSNYTNLNLTNLAIGTYYYNATWTNGSLSNITETRIFTVYNITRVIVSNPTGGSNVSRFLNVNWSAAYTNSSVSISNYTVFVMNNDSTLNRTLGTVSNLSFWGYDTFVNSLLRGNYSIKVLASDSLNNKINSSHNVFYITIDAELNITAFGYNGTQINTFNITFDGAPYNTTTGKITLGITSMTNYSIVMDAVGYALNSSVYAANSSSFQFKNFSLQANQSMNITIYNVATGLPITTQNFTVIVTTGTFRNYTATNGILYISDLDEGLNEIRAFNTLFAETVITKNVTSRSTQSVSIYLSTTNTTNNVTLIYQDVNGVPILNMYVTQSVLFNSSYTLMMDGYTDITGKVYFVYDPLYYYLYNNSLTGYNSVPFYLTPPRDASYTITVPFSSVYSTYNTVNVTGIVAYNNVTSILQFNYTSTDSTITNYSYSISKIINSQPVIICSSSSTTYPSDSFNCNVLGYTGLVYVQGVANGNRIFYGEWIDLGGKAKLFDNINSANANYFAGFLMLIIMFMGATFGVWATLVMGIVGLLFIYFIGLSSAVTLTLIGISVVVSIVIAVKLKRY